MNIKFIYEIEIMKIILKYSKYIFMNLKSVLKAYK
jgi:hypothetical protein